MSDLFQLSGVSLEDQLSAESDPNVLSAAEDRAAQMEPQIKQDAVTTRVHGLGFLASLEIHVYAKCI